METPSTESGKRGIGLASKSSGRQKPKEKSDVIPRHFLLGIGVSQYKNEYLNLRNARRDVEDFSILVKERFRFDEGSVFCLFDYEATIENFKERLNRIKGLIKNDDNLIVYFAGHGGYEAGKGNGFWCTNEFDDEKLHEGRLYEREIVSQIITLGCRRVLIIEDRCYGSRMQQVAARWHPTTEEISEKSVSLLSSSQMFEVASDGVSMNSPFAKTLLRVIKSNIGRKFSFNCELIEREFEDSVSFINLFSGSPVHDFSLYRDYSNFYFFDDLSVLNILNSYGLNNPNALRDFVEELPESDCAVNLKIKIRKGDAELEDQWNETMMYVYDRLAQFAQNFKYYYHKSRRIEKAIDLLLELKTKYPDIPLPESLAKDITFLDYLKNVLGRNEKIKYEYEMVSFSGIEIRSRFGFESENIDIGVNPVTVALFQNFSATEFFNFKDRICEKFGIDRVPPDLHPVTYIDRIEAIKFANWLSEKHGFSKVYRVVDAYLLGVNEKANGYRLPTSSEWEQIAAFCSVENFNNTPWCEANSNGKAREVAFVPKREIIGFQPPFDLLKMKILAFLKKIIRVIFTKKEIIGGCAPWNENHLQRIEVNDLLGNVYEWCWDIDEEPVMEDDKVFYKCKGGSYNTPLDELKISETRPFNERNLELGFRLVRSIYL